MTTDVDAPGLVADILIPGGHGRAVEVSAGQVIEIIDVEGGQVAEPVAFSARHRHEWMSATHTRSSTMRLNLGVGDVLVSNFRRPMYEITHDDVGIHDLVTAMCDERRYVLDYQVEGHRSCRTNFLEELEPYGIEEWEIPDTINFFQNAPIAADRSFGNVLPIGKPGDRLKLLVLMDSIFALSACPQDLNPCNSFNPTPIRVRVWA
ncbi:MAG: hypothetical protein JWO57_2838 [Pseudonocardiales bacterium]|nr:hypothetical protein [Pseudonocardiales bacterium]